MKATSNETFVTSTNTKNNEYLHMDTAIIVTFTVLLITYYKLSIRTLKKNK